jgi:hypothetical protein
MMLKEKRIWQMIFEVEQERFQYKKLIEIDHHKKLTSSSVIISGLGDLELILLKKSFLLESKMLFSTTLHKEQ